MIGIRYAFKTTVLARSYSRNSRMMSVEMQTNTPGRRASKTERTVCSWTGLA